ncbi:hypothetical protein ruthe_01123 [Rubellimicrobium thermophilum DSM 16684]|uniref:Uncharacterized protein n=1 Tax=Rubellimicrobium thermophilum DSM 16684 TaxID=1123069 RepID=S9SIW4_9RHOB|nr:hypothetical protein [Rubellimicrobium thermophilum]EPX86309.1 hypothetical protein ruthe_01123 [Rubellimicrobium thermophilum DSM 16684]
MALILDILLGAAFAALASGAVQIWRRQMEADRHEALRALAARRGWALTEGGRGLGRSGSMRITPRGGHPWTLEVRPEDGRTDFAAESPRWTEGHLVLAAAAPDRRDAAALVAEVPSMGFLRPAEAPAGFLMLNDGDPGRRLPLEDVAQLLRAWQPVVRGRKGLPLLMLTPEGIRLRLGHPLKRADQVERFADLALVISRIIGP